MVLSARGTGYRIGVFGLILNAAQHVHVDMNVGASAVWRVGALGLRPAAQALDAQLITRAMIYHQTEMVGRCEQLCGQACV